MKSNIFLPKTIRVGYQKRKDTYTGNLAYVIYIDAKGKVRKEASWTSWRDKKIDPTDFTNEPTSGFVLNKKAGGYDTGWNHRQTYCRVYDPRGFEFEITIPNLLYILENTSAIKGKGIEGDFVYGWDGTDLILMPTSAPDYTQLTEFADATFNKEIINSKNVILGATYRTNKNEDWIYLGRYDEWEQPYSYYNGTEKPINKGKKYWFRTPTGGIETTPSIGAKIIKLVDPTPVANYAELMDDVERMERYAPYHPDADVVNKVSIETLRKITETVENEYGWGTSYLTTEVCFTVDGVDLVAKLQCVRDRDSERKELATSNQFYLSNPIRRVPLDKDQFEYITEPSRGYYSRGRTSREEGWEQYGRYSRCGENNYRRDKQLTEIRAKLKKYTGNGYHNEQKFTLEELENQFGFSIRRKFLTNGKPLKTKYDDALMFAYVNTYDEISDAVSTLATINDNVMEAVNG